MSISDLVIKVGVMKSACGGKGLEESLPFQLLSFVLLPFSFSQLYVDHKLLYNAVDYFWSYGGRTDCVIRDEKSESFQHFSKSKPSEHLRFYFTFILWSM
jgi:hypothetical protein